MTDAGERKLYIKDFIFSIFVSPSQEFIFIQATSAVCLVVLQ